MGFHFVVLLALFTHDAGAALQEPRVELWAGHQVLIGKRKIPIYGEQETYTENFLLAEVRRTPTHLEIHERVCRIDIRPIKGTLASMKPETVARIPRSRMAFDEAADGKLTAAPWSHGWTSDDIDADGFPGATVHINGTCSGDVYISSESQTTLLSGHATADGASGTLSVKLKQKALGASGLCLKLVAGDTEETQMGWFDYRQVAPDATCHSLAGKPWPAKAQAPAPAAR
jgi:hypothetical protein